MYGASDEWLKKNSCVLDWDYHARECLTLDSMPPQQRRAAEAAIRYLKSRFGEMYLHRAFKVWHPITLMLTNKAPWTREWLIWLATALKDLEGAPGFNKVRRKLLTTRPNLAPVGEAESLMWVGHTLHAHGFDVGFEPTIKGFSRVPDILVQHPNQPESLYVEVTELFEGECERNASRMWNLVSRTADESGLEFRFKCHSIVEGPALAALVREVRALLDTALSEGRFQQLRVPGVLDFAVAPKHDAEALNKWSELTGAQSREGAPVPIDEVSRVKNKLWDKARQFVPGYANLLVVHLYHMILDSSTFDELISELPAEQKRYPDLVGTLLYSEARFASDPLFEPKTLDQHWFIGDTRPRVAFFSNPGFHNRLSDGFSADLKEAFSARTPS